MKQYARMTVVSLLLLAVPFAARAQVEHDKDWLQGTWTIVSVEKAGIPARDPHITRVLFKQDKLIALFKDHHT